MGLLMPKSLCRFDAINYTSLTRDAGHLSALLKRLEDEGNIRPREYVALVGALYALDKRIIEFPECDEWCDA
jgi:hypothetical protein